jgi:hypothetical protein
MWFWGLTSANSWPYLLWSGAGSDFLRLALIASAFRVTDKVIAQRHEHHKELKAMHERHHKELMGQFDDNSADR